MTTIVKLLPIHYDAWNEFCNQNHWFWHTTHWLEYIQNSKFGVEFKDHSFFIEQNGKIVNIVPLLQEGDQFISSGFEDRKEILYEVKRIAVENGIKRVRVSASIKEYLDISGYTCVLNLKQITPSKGHKSAIKKAEKYLTYTLCKNTVKFREDYYRIAGKITRPSVTFDILGRWIRLGFGTLLEAKLDGKTVGYTYILHYKDRAYYFASCVEPECREYNISHFLQAKAIEILRQKCIRWYELGEQVYPSLHCQPSEKEHNISLFKRGFGGEIVRNPASEYFFDRDYFEQVYIERTKNYKECVL